jgi:hypothetical protein
MRGAHTEISLATTAYNLKRILGAHRLARALDLA